MKNKNLKKDSLTIVAISWVLIIQIFFGNWIRINLVSEDWIVAYWVAVVVYFIGVYVAVANYLINKE